MHGAASVPSPSTRAARRFGAAVVQHAPHHRKKSSCINCASWISCTSSTLILPWRRRQDEAELFVSWACGRCQTRAISSSSREDVRIDVWLECLEFPKPEVPSRATTPPLSIPIEEGSCISNSELKLRFIELVKRYHPDTFESHNKATNDGGDTLEMLNQKITQIVDAHAALKGVPVSRRRRLACRPKDYDAASTTTSRDGGGGGLGAGGGGGLGWGCSRSTNTYSSYGSPFGEGRVHMGMECDEVPDASGALAWKVPKGPWAGAYKRHMFHDIPSAHNQFNQEYRAAANRRMDDSAMSLCDPLTLSQTAAGAPQFTIDWDAMFGHASRLKEAGGEHGHEEGEVLAGWLDGMRERTRRSQMGRGTAGSSLRVPPQSPAPPQSNPQIQPPTDAQHRLLNNQRLARQKEDNAMRQVLVIALLFSLMAICGCYCVVLRRFFGSRYGE